MIPAGPNTPFIPVRALGAPQTTCTSPLAGIDDADAQPVGIGVLLGRDDARHLEPGERRGRVVDPVDIVAEHDEPLDDLAEARLRVEMRLQPRQGRLHGSGPRTGEGMSSGRNP